LEVAVNDLITVPFRGNKLFLVAHDGEPYAPMKPIVEGMGIYWRGQHEKLRSNSARWGIKEILIPSAAGSQEMACMPLRKLPGWLMSVHPGKVKPGIREKIVTYQNECDDALWNYWAKGSAENPCKSHDWQQVRSSGKAVRHDLTDVIQDFVEYAQAQGSTNAHRYYEIVTKMENKALFLVEKAGKDLRDRLTMQQISCLSACEKIAAKALREGIAMKLPYKEVFQLAKQRVIAYVVLLGPTLPGDDNPA
jgi:hypothetical protein